MFGTASTASLRHGGPCPNVPVHPDAVFASSLPLIHLHFLAVRLLPSKCEQVFSEYNVKTAEVKAGYDGRSRGYGIVTFESEEDAAAGLALGGYNLDGREMLVRFDRQAGE